MFRRVTSKSMFIILIQVRTAFKCVLRKGIFSNLQTLSFVLYEFYGEVTICDVTNMQF